MRWFGWKSTVPASYVRNEPGFDLLKERYVRLCQSPLVSPKRAEQDLLELCSLSWVDQVTAVQGAGEVTLVIGTKCVYLLNSTQYVNCWHEIGRFAMVFRRRPNPEFYFYNQDRLVSNLEETISCHHPHVTEEGAVCSTDVPLILNAVAAGKLKEAAERSWSVLSTYGPNRPYVHLEHWPIVFFNDGIQAEGGNDAKYNAT